MKLPAKQITETKKSVKTSVKRKAIMETAVIPTVPVVLAVVKYELTVFTNSETQKVTGNGVEMLNLLTKPPKFVTKSLFTLENLETGKSFELAFPPLLTRKLFINSTVQAVQWKRLVWKTD